MVVGSSGGLEIYGIIASGGMATIQYARQATAAGALEVAIKRPHPHFANEPEFVKMFMDEAQLSIRIQHANVVRTLGVLEEPELGLILEYVLGESLARLLELAREAKQPLPIPVATGLIAGVLHGLHAAHETRGDSGQLLDVVHRDVAPDNILVGVDGVARVLDFGIAKALSKLRSTPSGELKGKLAYIAPEQLSGKATSRRTDVYGAGVVLWEALASVPLFAREHEAATIDAVLHRPVPLLHTRRADVPPALERIVSKAVARDPAARFDSAQAMARALELEVGVASQSIVVDWLEQLAGEQLRTRRTLLRSMRTQRHSVLALAPEIAVSELPPSAANALSTAAWTAPAQTLVRPEPEPVAPSMQPTASWSADTPANDELATPELPLAAAPLRRGSRARVVPLGALLILAAFALVWARSRSEPAHVITPLADGQAREQTSASAVHDAPAVKAQPAAAQTRDGYVEPRDLAATPRPASADPSSPPASPSAGNSAPPAREATTGTSPEHRAQPSAATPSERQVPRSREPPLGTAPPHRAAVLRARGRAKPPAPAAASQSADLAAPQPSAAEPKEAAKPASLPARRLKPTGPDACYDTVVRNGLVTRVPKAACL